LYQKRRLTKPLIPSGWKVNRANQPFDFFRPRGINSIHREGKDKGFAFEEAGLTAVWCCR
ncbi:MAG: hypothetical protein ACK53L_12215, partial [Pirellulaceae bacterium]